MHGRTDLPQSRQMGFFLRAYERGQGYLVAASGQVAQHMPGFHPRSGIGRIGNNLGEEKDMHTEFSYGLAGS